MEVSSQFRPPLESPLTLALARTLLPLAMRYHCAVQRVEISEDDIARLQKMREERVVLTPNHPTNSDPALIFELSTRARMKFNFLACREAFDAHRGLWGAFIQRIGAYSVVRGTIDRESFRYTRTLLARPGAKLVLFPEGEVYSQNDSLLPFQMGAVQLALWGREEARKTEPEAQVWLLPCAVRYKFSGDVTGALHERLARMEKELKLAPERQNGQSAPLQELYPRMRRVASRVLEAVEREYGLKSVPGDDWTPRVEAAKEAALKRAASLLAMELPRGTLPERMRSLLHAAEEEMHDQHEQEPIPATLAQQQVERARLAGTDLKRLANWIALYDGYVGQSPVQERIAEVVYRLEVEVFGQAAQPGLRVATVRVGEPLPLPEKLSRRELPEMTIRLEQAVQALLSQSSTASTV